ncbi:hypothetical protein [Chondromyces crocatus]|uniref:Secreted protein n=1 Tax=Chondromyces crocatus TaxID=52 RepID=A0A0K1EIN4_CHOCO|nr:hypothetical protein [Chondromyces crocatus]AKT40453.1 uncharacterized protein CMC5_046080 [Chondromyces crocatus]
MILKSPLRALSIATFLLVTPLLSGCGGDDGDSTGKEDTDPPDDGKLRPPTNGVRIAEAEACQTLLDAFDDKRTELGCTLSTGRTCPDLVRAQVMGDRCLQYDQGTVNGCTAHYDAQIDCATLTAAMNDCVVTAYSGTTSPDCS